eukprot:scaffold73185_cov31-Tisochrysis_lutea.AAC.6
MERGHAPSNFCDSLHLHVEIHAECRISRLACHELLGLYGEAGVIAELAAALHRKACELRIAVALLSALPSLAQPCNAGAFGALTRAAARGVLGVWRRV